MHRGDEGKSGEGPLRRFALAAVAALAVSSSAAQADDVYMNFFGGLNIVPGQDLSYDDAGPTVYGPLHDGTVSYDKGLGFGAAIGYAVDVGAGFALYGEAEVSYRTNTIDYNKGINENGDVEEGDEDGHSNILAGMANLGLRYRVVDGLSLHAAGGIGYASWSYGYDGNPEQGSWSERHCAHCEGTGHAADDRPGAATLCCFGALLLALVYWWTR